MLLSFTETLSQRTRTRNGRKQLDGLVSIFEAIFIDSSGHLIGENGEK